VARRVDEIDRHVLDRERDDGCLDRDPAPPLELERVGLGRAAVDAAGRVDQARVEQQTLRERRLTGVYMRQDPEIERPSKHRSYPPKWS
jgi:hypothetical protein